MSELSEAIEKLGKTFPEGKRFEVYLAIDKLIEDVRERVDPELDNGPWFSTSSATQLRYLFNEMSGPDDEASTYMQVLRFEEWYRKYLKDVDTNSGDYCLELLILLAHRIALTVTRRSFDVNIYRMILHSLEPWLSYYELLQLNPERGLDEVQDYADYLAHSYVCKGILLQDNLSAILELFAAWIKYSPRKEN